MEFLARALLLAFSALCVSQLALVAALAGMMLGLPSTDGAHGFQDPLSLGVGELFALPAAGIGWVASLGMLRRANLAWALPMVTGTAVLTSFLGVLVAGPVAGVVITLVASLFAMALAPDENWPPSGPLSPNGPWSATSSAEAIDARVRARAPQQLIP